MKMIFRSIVLMGVLGTGVFFGCSKDDENEPDKREKYLGFYNVTEACLGNGFDYVIQVKKAPNENQIVITNFGDGDADITADIDGNGGIYLNSTVAYKGNSYTVKSKQVKIEGTVMNMEYTVDNDKFYQEEQVENVSYTCRGQGKRN